MNQVTGVTECTVIIFTWNGEGGRRLKRKKEKRWDM